LLCLIKKGKNSCSEALKKWEKKYTYAKDVKENGQKNTSGFATTFVLFFVFKVHFIRF